MEKAPTREHFEFLPAAIEIQETPPSPAGRAILWAIVLFLLVALAWAMVGEIDIVAVARGKIIPSGHVKVIQPLEIGVIRVIRVHEGQSVKKGEVLIELDPTASGAEGARIANEMRRAHIERARLEVLLELIAARSDKAAGQDRTALSQRIAQRYTGDLAAQPDQAGSAPTPQIPDLATQAAILANQYAEFHARRAALDQELARHQAEQTTTRARVAKLVGTLPLVRRRAEAMKALADRKLAATLDYLTLEQQRIEQVQDLAAERSRLQETRAAIAATARQRDAMQAEFKRARLLELAEAERNIAGLSKELIKIRQRIRMRRLEAPVAGVVENLTVHTTGGVVTPAQALLQIVPLNEQLEVQAWIANRDIGFVRKGQTAEVKVEAFPFTRYGTIDAEIAEVSNDAVAKKDLGLVYALRVLLKKSVVRVGDRLVNLTPGMAVTVEVKTGKRRIIEFIVSPLLRGIKETGHER